MIFFIQLAFMKTSAAFLSAVCLVLGFSSCSNIMVKQPAGDKVPELKAEVWEGTWLGADGFRGQSLIVNAKEGIVEIKSLEEPDEKPAVVKVRELGSRVVVTAVDKDDPKGPAPFMRAAVSDDYAAFFPIKEETFMTAVKNGKLRGKIEVKKYGPDNSGERSEAVLESLTGAEAKGISVAAAEDTAALFEADPALVLVREKRPEKAEPK